MMRRYLTHTVVAALTFTVGVSVASFWFVARQPLVQEQVSVVSFSTAPLVEPSREAVIANGDAKVVLISSHPNYPHIVGTLEKLAAHRGKTQKNTFYISPVKNDNGEYAYAYWKQDKSIIILHLPMDEENVDFYWLEHKARIDLVKDVVPTGKYENLGCCLEEKDWMDVILADCLSGHKLIIPKNKKVMREAQSNNSFNRSANSIAFMCETCRWRC